MENKELVVQNPTEKWNKEQIDAIKNTVAVGANDSELTMFLSLAAKYDLDPFAREIWFIQAKDRNIITTGRDGYLKIANRDPNFDGMISDVVHLSDKFVKENDTVKHLYNVGNRGPIIGAYAVVYRKDRAHPAYFFAPFSEYNKGFNAWKQYPSAMIQKVAEACALKRAFSISGLVTEEEIGTGSEKEEKQELQTKKDAPDELSQETIEQIRRENLSQLWTRYLDVCDNQKNHAINAMKAVTGKEKSSDYDNEDIKKLFADIQRREDEKMSKEIEARNEDEKSGIDNVIDVFNQEGAEAEVITRNTTDNTAKH